MNQNEAQKSEKFDPKEEKTIFHKIVSKEIPSASVYEDDDVYAFRDIQPQAPTHIVVIPKKMQGLNMLSSATEEHITILGKLMYVASVVAKKDNLDKGYRVVVNCGQDGCQSVNYLHLHVLGGRKLGWPPG